MTLIRRIDAGEIQLLRRSVTDAETLATSTSIVNEVRELGLDALLRFGASFGDWREGEPWLIEKSSPEKALEVVQPEIRSLLERTADRIRSFAQSQLDSLSSFQQPIPGGIAGQEIVPVQRVACYAPGGRYPLPSSVLMTAVTAQVAGVDEIIVASPHPDPVTLAAAAIAGASTVLTIGGAQAIAALAYGVDGLDPVDIIVGPGNKFVTAAKLAVAGDVAIDLPGGPSELVVLADNTANPVLVASDLLAQAEHDPDAIPILVTTDSNLVDAVERELAFQIADLSTAGVARQSLRNGYLALATTMEEAADAVNRIAPEHLQLQLESVEEVRPLLRNYGALFLGEEMAEVFGDYGAGPNHVLPTGGTARSFAGLSVHNFLRIRTWMQGQGSATELTLLAQDAASLGRLEGLEAHARAAEKRILTADG